MDNDRIWTLVSRKISGEATASELSELDTLIRSQENLDIYLQAIEEYWKMPLENDPEFLEATYHLHLNRMSQKGFNLEAGVAQTEPGAFYLEDSQPATKSFAWRYGLMALTVLSVLTIFFALWFGTNTNDSKQVAGYAQLESEVITRSGSRTKIQLPDGTLVWLNGGSKLVYDGRRFGDKNREVTLTGEAYFDVVKNSSNPFIIHANNIHVKVIGTAFNVKAYPGEKTTETSLIRGSIEVSLDDRTEKILMKPNDKLVVTNNPAHTGIVNAGNNGAGQTATNSVISLGQLTLANDESTVLETAWVDNKLAFDHERFEEVALKMERWYGVTIRFKNERLKNEPLSGTFEMETVAEALHALQLSTPLFKYTINNNNITIYK